MKIVSVKQIQAIEQSADAAGLSYDEMMHNAGEGIAEWVYQHLDLKQGVIGLIGSGNNGGDTIIALTCLAQMGVRTTAILVKTRGDDSLLETYRLFGGALLDISKNEHLDFFEASLIRGVVVLDGILGTGLTLPLRGELSEVMASIYERLVNRLDVLKIAVDCPSGVDCDSGAVSDVTFAVDHTLTMAAMKQGLLRHPARSFAGKLHFIGIGIDDLSEHITDDLPKVVDHDVIPTLLPKRPDSGHKGTFGTCLVLAGSAPYTGAAYLTGKSAYLAGCGLVHMGTHKVVHHSLSGRLIEAVWTIMPDVEGSYDPQGLSTLGDVLLTTNSIVVGPGWGLSDQNTAFLEALLESIPETTPTLFDADGLKLLGQLDKWWEKVPDHSVLTPHPGEMAILSGLDVSEIQSNRWEIAIEYARQWNVVLVLKGAVTVIACPNQGIYINPTSDAALATAGSGDVLSGTIGGLMAQGVKSHSATVLGVWVHGMAGQIAGSTLPTSLSVTALDVMDNLSKAFLKAKEAGL